VTAAKSAKSLEIEFSDGRFTMAQGSLTSSAKAPKQNPPEQGQLL
jgi:hypothetical protein